MEIIDTHCHLYSDQFSEDIDLVIQNAKNNHLSKIILPNIDEESFEAMQSLYTKEPTYFEMGIGIHPCSVKKDYTPQIEWVKKELQTGKYVSVGEIGIDLYWDKTLVIEQKDAFRQQIQLAKEFDLPIIIHARDSMNEIFEVLDEEMDAKLHGVFHCFIGEEAEIKKVDNYENFMFGLGGVLTFKNSTLKNFIDLIPMEKIILETDAPYLSPVPNRGKRNEPAYTRNVAEFLADLKLKEIEEIAKITTDNAKRLFKI
jgi:TatD DNase family protein